MLTRAKVAYNLYKTPHKLQMSYKGQEVIYYFSSELYKSKFNARMETSREEITESLSKRFGIKIECNILADLRLYSSIEKRGYLISINGEYIECQNNITLDGLKMMIEH